MEIADSFRVSTPIADTWKVLLDIEGIAPCLPGAQLQEIAGEEYRGVVKVKVGPITAQYKGAAHFESRDDATHTAVIIGTGRDTRGQGNASATITMQLTADGSGTAVKVATDLSITGKVAQFGRGVMADVSAKILAQFVENLERDVLSGPIVDLMEEEAPAEVGASIPGAASLSAGNPAGADPHDPALTGPPTSNGSGDHAAGGDTTTVRTINSPEATPVDLFEMSGSSLLKRLAPLIGAGLVAAGLTWWLLRRRSAR
jgi:carbon monoxide dehydrogenase subunit G